MQQRSMGRPGAAAGQVRFKTEVIVTVGLAIGVSLGLLTAILGLR
jgi:hypothetical protein